MYRLKTQAHQRSCSLRYKKEVMTTAGTFAPHTKQHHQMHIATQPSRHLSWETTTTAPSYSRKANSKVSCCEKLGDLESESAVTLS